MTFNYNDADDQLLDHPQWNVPAQNRDQARRTWSDGMLRLAKNLRGLMLECTYTVVNHGEHAGHKIWDYVTRRVRRDRQSGVCHSTRSARWLPHIGAHWAARE